MCKQEYRPPGIGKIKGPFIAIGRNGKIENLSGKCGILNESSQNGSATLIIGDQKIRVPPSGLAKPKEREEKDETK